MSLEVHPVRSFRPAFPRLVAGVVASLAVVLDAAAQSAGPLPPDTLAKALPAAWGDMTRGTPATEATNYGMRSNRATVTLTGKRGSTEPFVAQFTLVDEGTYGAQMYASGASYLKGDVRSDSEHSIVLPGGRRALVTEATKDSMMVETQVGGRFVARTGCSRATEAACIAAFGHWDFKAIEALAR